MYRKQRNSATFNKEHVCCFDMLKASAFRVQQNVVIGRENIILIIKRDAVDVISLKDMWLEGKLEDTLYSA